MANGVDVELNVINEVQVEASLGNSVSVDLNTTQPINVTLESATQVDVIIEMPQVQVIEVELLHNVLGPGPAGVDGKTILSGRNDPTDLVGTVGDFYINTTTWTLFGPKRATLPSRTNKTSLIGPAGTGGTGTAEYTEKFDYFVGFDIELERIADPETVKIFVQGGNTLINEYDFVVDGTRITLIYPIEEPKNIMVTYSELNVL